MIEITALSGPVQATLLVGAIFAQAVFLYAGYGVLERVVMSLLETITGA